MGVVATNSAASTLTAAITTTATSLTIALADAALFPNPSGGQWFPLTLIDSSGNVEIVRCSARSSNTMTIVRAQEGTTAKAFPSGSRVSLRMTAAAFDAKLDADRVSAFGLGLVGSADSAAGRTALGLGSAALAASTDFADATATASALGNRLRFDAAQTLSAPQAAQAKTNMQMRFTAGQALPTADVGPIWHDDYGGWMTWQVFNANGAAYTGYASAEIGLLRLETQPTPRTGWIASGVTNLSRAAYPALRAWAQHNGIYVAIGSWVAGSLLVADNADGTTFRIYDVRGEFPRFWDNGRGIDASRTFGSSQLDAFQGHKFNVMYSDLSGSTGGSDMQRFNAATSSLGSNFLSGPVTDGTNGTPRTAAETRSRNSAFLATVKF